jgi:hypothetical protein
MSIVEKEKNAPFYVVVVGMESRQRVQKKQIIM